ncbi:MAG: hypothetical protein ACJAX4_003620 [Clostridium sp.]|jgi:hypothetical protein
MYRHNNNTAGSTIFNIKLAGKLCTPHLMVSMFYYMVTYGKLNSVLVYSHLNLILFIEKTYISHNLVINNVKNCKALTFILDITKNKILWRFYL